MVYYREYFRDRGIFENEVYPGIPELLMRLRERGMTLCSEFHLWTFNDCVESARLLAEAGVGTYWQPFQTLPPEENLKIAEALGEAVETVHVFNWAGGDRFPLADALDDWRRYLAVLPNVRTLLLEFMPDDRVETLAAESDALRQIAEWRTV